MKITQQPPATAPSLLAAALVLFALIGANGQTVKDKAKWSAFTELELHNVKIRGNSLVEAWVDMSRGAELRSVLFSRASQSSDSKQFVFDRENCTVGELLQAFEDTYPPYVHDLDINSGVLWLHPRNVAYEIILTQKVKVNTGAFALPMLSGILAPMERIRPLGIFGPAGPSLRTVGLDYAVDLPEGTFSVKDILNCCLIENPGEGFYISKQKADWIQPLDLGYRNIFAPAETAVYFWYATIGSAEGAFPNPTEILNALSSTNTATVERSRAYMQMNQAAESWDALFAAAKTPREIVWASVAMASVEDRSDQAACLAAGEKLRQVLSSTNSVSLGVQVLAAITEAQAWSNEISDLERIANQPASEKELSSVLYDIIRILRDSPRMRQKLMELNPPWVGFSKAEIEALGRTDKIFSLP